MPPLKGMDACPASRYRDIVAPAAAAPQPSSPRGAWPGRAISQKPSPPMLFMCGYTTAMVAAAATMASTALPPSRSTALALWAASECGATAMPRALLEEEKFIECMIGGFGKGVRWHPSRQIYVFINPADIQARLVPSQEPAGRSRKISRNASAAALPLGARA